MDIVEISDSSDEDDSSDEGDSTNDYIVLLKDIPTQFFFIETLEGTLEDLLDTIGINKISVLSLR